VGVATRAQRGTIQAPGTRPLLSIVTDRCHVEAVPPSAPAHIRLARLADAPALADIYRPAVVGSATSFELDPPDAAEMERRVGRILERTPWLVCEVDGVVAGYAYAGAHRERAAYRWSVDVAVYVRPGARRGGVGHALYTSLLAAVERQGFRNAYAGITLPNAASIGLHTAMGFTPVGVYRGVGYKLGAWHDVAWLARSLAPHDPVPDEPLLLPVIAESPTFRAALTLGESVLRGRHAPA
jgi:L-amino acid N-acyltransferase YncA